ncbi:hypothetical protein B0H11DRAFT_1914840 [Mycena galericulata]|nr:hypothetical protein B0H11DRAFT_1914840 [Mycena galericulata]
MYEALQAARQCRVNHASRRVTAAPKPRQCAAIASKSPVPRQCAPYSESIGYARRGSFRGPPVPCPLYFSARHPAPRLSHSIPAAAANDDDKDDDGVGRARYLTSNWHQCHNEVSQSSPFSFAAFCGSPRPPRCTSPGSVATQSLWSTAPSRASTHPFSLWCRGCTASTFGEKEYQCTLIVLTGVVGCGVVRCEQRDNAKQRHQRDNQNVRRLMKSAATVWSVVSALYRPMCTPSPVWHLPAVSAPCIDPTCELISFRITLVLYGTTIWVIAYCALLSATEAVSQCYQELPGATLLPCQSYQRLSSLGGELRIYWDYPGSCYVVPYNGDLSTWLSQVSELSGVLRLGNVAIMHSFNSPMTWIRPLRGGG